MASRMAPQTLHETKNCATEPPMSARSRHTHSPSRPALASRTLRDQAELRRVDQGHQAQTTANRMWPQGRAFTQHRVPTARQHTHSGMSTGQHNNKQPKIQSRTRARKNTPRRTHTSTPRPQRTAFAQSNSRQTRGSSANEQPTEKQVCRAGV